MEAEEQQIPAWPLAWPSGWPRTPADSRTQGSDVTPARVDANADARARTGDVLMIDAVARILAPLRTLGVRDWQVVISTNLALKDDASLQFQQEAPRDPGAAVYWNTAEPGWPYRCVAYDAHTTVAANLGKIAQTIEALVALWRAGGDEILARALAGLSTMPPTVNRHTTWWADTLGIAEGATLEEITRAYRRKRGQSHPDRGGDANTFRKVHDAYVAARTAVVSCGR